MKKSGNQYSVVMHDYMKELFKGCVESLSLLLSAEEDVVHKYSYEDVFNYSQLLRMRKQIEESKNDEVSFELPDWVAVYTALGIHCIVFSEKSIAKLRNEVLAHPELGSERELEQIFERNAKVRTAVHNMEERFGHKELFKQRHEEMTRRGWFKMMDPLPKYAVRK